MAIGPGSDASNSEVAELRGACEAAILGLDEGALNQVLARARMRLSQPILLEELLGPLLVWVGDAWHAGTLRVAHEHLASVSVRAFLMRLRESFQPAPSAPKVLLATPAGEPHECGALLAAAAAASAGWHPVFIGPDLPAAEIANAAATLEADAVALSIAMPGDAPATAEEVRTLRRYLPETVPLVLGGGGAAVNRLSYEAPGVTCVSSLTEFVETLDSLSEMRRLGFTSGGKQAGPLQSDESTDETVE
jgi:methanogenic corrinoid protein MtbC1